jgi:hypothetical protein
LLLFKKIAIYGSVHLILLRSKIILFIKRLEYAAERKNGHTELFWDGQCGNIGFAQKVW